MYYVLLSITIICCHDYDSNYPGGADALSMILTFSRAERYVAKNSVCDDTEGGVGSGVDGVGEVREGREKKEGTVENNTNGNIDAGNKGQMLMAVRRDKNEKEEELLVLSAQLLQNLVYSSGSKYAMVGIISVCISICICVYVCIYTIVCGFLYV